MTTSSKVSLYAWLLTPLLSGLLVSAPSFAATANYVPPYIMSFSPASGPAGTVVTLIGSGFTGSTAAWVGAAHNAGITVVTDSQARVTVPAGATTGAIAILNPAGASFTATAFTMSGSGATNPQPYIQSFSPAAGAAGTMILLLGSGFTGANAAWIGGAHDADISVLSDTQVQVVVPADAATGQIAILNPQHASFSATAFTVSANAPSPPPAPTPPPTPTPPPATPPPAAGSLSVRVQGNHFINTAGATIQLRGVNYSGFEFAPIQGWSGSDPSGAQAGQAGGPKWSALQSWKVNTLRIPLNEASWLGYSCTDTSGIVHNPDPAGNYKSVVQAQVAQANAAGIYVILDLHWTAPGIACPMLQTQMADRDHSIAFWTSVATMFKGKPAVLFELFNEPFMNFDFSGDSWAYMMKGTGGSFSGYPATSNSGNWKDVKQPWAIASMQAMLSAVRATGATNVVLVGTMQYSQDFSGWLANRPTDPLNQMAAVWHPYPTFGTTWGTAAYAQPNYAPAVFSDVLRIQAAGFPVIATETGDRNTPGTVGAPLVTTVTTWSDLHGVSVIGWTWDVWGDSANVLIKDGNGTPTDGYGQVFRAWLLAH